MAVDTEMRPRDPLLQAATAAVNIFAIILRVVLVGLIVGVPAMLIWRGQLGGALHVDGYHGDPQMLGFAIAVIGACGAIVVFLALRFALTLLRIMGTVREGDPFVPENAVRLRTMGWLQLGMQATGFVAGAFGNFMLHDSLTFGGSITGVITALVLFILARVFAAGTAMRAEIEGTV